MSEKVKLQVGFKRTEEMVYIPLVRVTVVG